MAAFDKIDKETERLLTFYVEGGGAHAINMTRRTIKMSGAEIIEEDGTRMSYQFTVVFKGTLPDFFRRNPPLKGLKRSKIREISENTREMIEKQREMEREKLKEQGLL